MRKRENQTSTDKQNKLNHPKRLPEVICTKQRCLSSNSMVGVTELQIEIAQKNERIEYLEAQPHSKGMENEETLIELADIKEELVSKTKDFEKALEKFRYEIDTAILLY